ncbi:hypothetical protein [Gordonibacter urolithinfaciens]|uniref:Uncharacterized protein n=1 Tax=Gordonibacter urolithinfaciens TaxID=1335613 RepID=A0A6N8II99_9ACTN|nr:hypothetical protein [Gordonibacter urolithinfaciens]MVN15649.1 hypothetical protein [Gordonibacter urolithinfaciens]MVN40309.1 hypothetical protein [Gordonibacter urolithinfaciens]MVN60954.1 hypothetical protein [Gordonibacter urolithinfaciens]
MNGKLRELREKMLDAFEGRKRTAVISGCAAVVFIVAACFPAIAANQINLSSESSKTEELIAAEDANISGDDPADQGNAGMKLSDTEPCAPDIRPSESQSAKKSIAADQAVAGGNATVVDEVNASTSSSNEDSAKSQSGSSSTSDSQKTWVEDIERMWVVDRAAWVETIPVYESLERSICNICGADITGSTSDHNKQHMLAGEGSGYHSEVQRVKIGEETIEHREEGHWETVVVGGHWE